MRFYAVAEDWKGTGGVFAEDILNGMLFDADKETLAALEYEAHQIDSGEFIGTPIMDLVVHQAENTIFSFWVDRPRSGHSLRIAWED